VGDFYVLVDFVILDMTEDACTEIILGRPFLATAGCKIDVKGGRLTFDIGEHHAHFGLFKDHESSFSSCGYDLMSLWSYLMCMQMILMSLIMCLLRAIELIIQRWIWLTIWHLA